MKLFIYACLLRFLLRRVKWCERCSAYRLRSEFGANRTTSDGLDAWCRPHRRAYMREYRREEYWRKKREAEQA